MPCFDAIFDQSSDAVIDLLPHCKTSLFDSAAICRATTLNYKTTRGGSYVNFIFFERCNKKKRKKKKTYLRQKRRDVRRQSLLGRNNGGEGFSLAEEYEGFEVGFRRRKIYKSPLCLEKIIMHGE